MKDDFLKGKRILIAEDDFVNQKLITLSMKSTGAHFDIAGNGKEAIQFLDRGVYDLILMDINMPEMDGFEATDHIRNKMKLTLPIIAMTGWSTKEDSYKFLVAGMDGTLAKPFGLEALYIILKETLVSEFPELAEPSPDETMLVDLSMLNELAETDTAYKRTIINMFLESMPETLQQIEIAYSVKNWEELAKAAHYAKSSLSVINVEKMRLLVSAIELNSKKLTNLDQIGDMVVDLRKKYIWVVRYLQEVLANY